MLWVCPPFNMLISGITNCGKTRFVLDLLVTEYRSCFDYIVIFCPTFKNNTSYDQRFVYEDPDIIVLPPDLVQRDLNGLLRLCTEVYGACGQTLFLIDDCANQRAAKTKSCELTRLAFSGRHENISVWLVTQKYNAVVKDFRDNIRQCVLYYEKDRKSLEDALNENGIIPAEEHATIVEKLKATPHSKLVLRLEHPYPYEIVHGH